MNIRSIARTSVLLLTLGASLTACGGGSKSGPTTTTEKAAPPASGTLYERLGGQPAITAVVEDFIANVVADARINAFFTNIDGKKLHDLLIEQICAATGGPCTYTGRDMKTTHKGMNIKEEHFNALVEDLVKSLDKFKVPEKEKGELLGALGGLKGDIVGQ